ncbi:von Willebrand factor A domain-containing 3B, partial [Brachionus plicatilis]
EDLISGIKSPSFDLDIGDPVLATHPEYESSYAPGQVIDVSNDMKTYYVRFYDDEKANVSYNEIFKMHRIKFQFDINEILRLEKRWIGQKIIARNNNKRVYELGKVVRKVDMGRKYEMEWSDGTESIQNANHMFGKFTRKQTKHNLDYVLAPKGNVYLPGRITARRGNQFIVRYFDDSLNEHVSEEACFWLSKCYYEDAAQFCRNQSMFYKDFDEHNFIQKDISESNHSIGRKTPVVSAKDFFTGKTSVFRLKQK